MCSVQAVGAETFAGAAADRDAAPVFPPLFGQSDAYTTTIDRNGRLLLASGSQPRSETPPQPDAAPGNSSEAGHASVFTTAGNDLGALGGAAATPEFWRTALGIAGISLVSAIADKPLDTLAVNHGKNWVMTHVEKIGNSLPFIAIGYSAVTFLASDQDSTLARASYSSLAAGGVGFAGVLGLKYTVGRARPSSEQGPASFTPVNAHNGNTSWPSMHSTVMWAVITPYAQAYDAPWLYGAAAVTNIARIGGRDHWFSDTVAGSLLGYALGSFMWQQHNNDKRGMELGVSPNGVRLSWKME